MPCDKPLEDYDPGTVIFIHIPRTAGRSICHALDIKLSHEPYFRREPLLNRQDEYSFSVVRNPWDQVASWHVSANIEATVGLNLSDWVLRGYPGLRSVGAPEDWFNAVHPFDQLGRCGDELDDIFEFEKIEKWWPSLSNRELPHIGTTGTYGGTWTQDAADRVALSHGNEDLIDLYDYEEPTDVEYE